MTINIEDPNILLFQILAATAIILIGRYLIMRWLRRKQSKQEVLQQSLATRLKRIETQLIDLQKRLEALEHLGLPRLKIQMTLEEFEKRISNIEKATKLSAFETIERPEERHRHQNSEENNLNKKYPKKNFTSTDNVSGEEYFKIEAAIALYKQQSAISGDLFIPLSSYLKELHQSRITIDEIESRSIIDKLSRRYPGSVRIEQVRGKPDKQIAILDEYINQ